MPRKNVLTPVKTLSAGSLAASINSSPTNIQFLDDIAIQINILSGTPSGSFDVQGSLDYAPGGAGTDYPPTVGNWVSISGLSTTITTGTPANILYNLAQLGFPWIRIAYTRTSGTGTADIWVSAKSMA